MHYVNAIEQYTPFNEAERRDKENILAAAAQYGDDVLTRECSLAHMTVSAFVVNPLRDRILLAHHNQRNCWAWPGGHSDGETHLLQTALKELQEETGLSPVEPPVEKLFSLDILPVYPHQKGGKYISCHLHLNATYLFVCDDQLPVQVCPAENTAIDWFSPLFLQQGPLNDTDKELYHKLFLRAKDWR